MSTFREKVYNHFDRLNEKLDILLEAVKGKGLPDRKQRTEPLTRIERKRLFEEFPNVSGTKFECDACERVGACRYGPSQEIRCYSWYASEVQKAQKRAAVARKMPFTIEQLQLMPRTKLVQICWILKINPIRLPDCTMNGLISAILKGQKVRVVDEDRSKGSD